MSIKYYSEDIILVDLPHGDVEISEELKSLLKIVRDRTGDCNVVIECSGVEGIYQSSLNRLLVLHKLLAKHGHRLILCGLAAAHKGIFVVCGFDMLFEFADDKSEALERLEEVAGQKVCGNTLMKVGAIEPEQNNADKQNYEEIPKIDHEEFYKRSIGEKIFLSCIAFLTILFLIPGIVGVIIDHASSYDTRLLLSLAIAGIVVFFYFYDISEKIFFVLLAILIPLFNILGLIIDHTLQMWVYVFVFVMTFIELGVHYKWQIYDYSSHTLSDGGAA
jgi:anti-anti-sigma regulatory factor